MSNIQRKQALALSTIRNLLRTISSNTQLSLNAAKHNIASAFNYYEPLNELEYE